MYLVYINMYKLNNIYYVPSYMVITNIYDVSNIYYVYIMYTYVYIANLSTPPLIPSLGPKASPGPPDGPDTWCL